MPIDYTGNPGATFDTTAIPLITDADSPSAALLHGPLETILDDLAILRASVGISDVCHITLGTGALVSSKVVLDTIVHNPTSGYSTGVSNTVLYVPSAGFYWVSFNFGLVSDDTTSGIEMMARLNRQTTALLNCFQRRWSTTAAHETAMHASGLIVVEDPADGLSIEATASLGTPAVYAAQNPTLSIFRLPFSEDLL